MREGHPRVGRRLTLEQYLSLEHVVVAPLGRPSQVDRALAARGRERRIRQVVPYFVSGLHIATTTDCVATLSDRAAMALAPTLGLRLLEPPIPLEPYALNLLWHPRLENEPANRWLRQVFVRAAREGAPERQAPRPGRRGPKTPGMPSEA